MKYLAFIIAVLLCVTSLEAKLMGIKLTIIKEGPGWKYVVAGPGIDQRVFTSDKELGDFLKTLSNPEDGIQLIVESRDYVGVDELINILTMTKANPQDIEVTRVSLHTGIAPGEKAPSTQPAE